MTSHHSTEAGFDAENGRRKSPERKMKEVRVGLSRNKNNVSKEEQLLPATGEYDDRNSYGKKNDFGNEDFFQSASIGNAQYMQPLNTYDLSYSKSDDGNLIYHEFRAQVAKGDSTQNHPNYYSSNSSSASHSMDGGSDSSAFDTYAPDTKPAMKIYHSLNAQRKSLQELEIVDAIYEERYGERYTDKPIRYIYPHGYGSMRPRSLPWQISLISTIIFAWLNVFIVGHCSDKYELNYQYDDQYQMQNIDDAAGKIEARWCGSQTLYFMWVLSVMMTGLSCAYCSIIGYVKARDFAVGNGRSQPPGMRSNSDYYIQVESGSVRFMKEDTDAFDSAQKSRYTYSIYHSGGRSDGTNTKIIYQSDGNPRFLGGKIYHPNQAAVNMTSR